jgi:hypothetical protein
MSEKPLNARVAEALGFKVRDLSKYGCTAQCVSGPSEAGAFHGARSGPHDHIRWEYWKPYEWEDDGDWKLVENYDTDWSASGQLVEKNRVTITDFASEPWMAARDFTVDYDGWRAGEYAYGRTPLVALCNLILALKESGKL